MDMAMELELQVGNYQSKHQTNPTGEEKEIKEENQEEKVENGQSEQEEQLPNPTNGEEKEIKEENQEEQVENGQSEQEKQLPNPTGEEMKIKEEVQEEQVENGQSEQEEQLPNPTKGEEKEIKEENQEEQVKNGQSEQEQQLPNPTNGEENQEEQVENGQSEQEEQLPNPTEEGLTTEDEKVENKFSVVLRANLHCNRCKTRLLKDACREHGVNSILIEDENNIKVNGNMDPIRLVSRLRKRTASVNLVSVHNERPPLERKKVSSYSRPKTILEKKNVVLKWIFILMNVGLELCQAVASQEAGDGKIRGSVYRKLSVILSSICLILSFVKLLEEGKRGGVKWQRKRGCYCFYYPGKYGRILGRFSLWFGLISATVQFSLSVASLVIKRGMFKFDHLGLLLSVNYLLAALGGKRSAMLAKVRCSLHGRNEAEGELVEGMWEFHCPECPPEKLA